MDVPNVAIKHYNIGCELLKQKNFSEAYNQFEKALKHYPDFVSANINMGSCLRKSGRSEASLVYYLTAISLEDTNALAYFHYGLALFDLDWYKEAAEAVGKAVELSPFNCEMRCFLARFIAMDTISANAFFHALKAISLRPFSTKGYIAFRDVLLLTLCNLFIPKSRR